MRIRRIVLSGMCVALAGFGLMSCQTMMPIRAESGSAAMASSSRQPTVAYLMAMPEPSLRVSGSVYDFFSTRSPATLPVPLKSYVLFVNQAESARNVAFLREVMRGAGGSPTAAAPGSAEDLRDQNLFLIGVTDRDRARAVATGPEAAEKIIGQGYYDYDYAKRFWRTFCRLVTHSPPACREDVMVGPYVVVLPNEDSRLDRRPGRYLVVSLSPREPVEFRAHVTALLKQVKRHRFDDREDVDAWKLSILSVLLAAGNAVSLTNEAFAKTWNFDKDH